MTTKIQSTCINERKPWHCHVNRMTPVSPWCSRLCGKKDAGNWRGIEPSGPTSPTWFWSWKKCHFGKFRVLIPFASKLQNPRSFCLQHGETVAPTWIKDHHKPLNLESVRFASALSASTFMETFRRKMDKQKHSQIIGCDGQSDEEEQPPDCLQKMKPQQNAKIWVVGEDSRAEPSWIQNKTSKGANVHCTHRRIPLDFVFFRTAKLWVGTCVYWWIQGLCRSWGLEIQFHPVFLSRTHLGGGGILGSQSMRDRKFQVRAPTSSRNLPGQRHRGAAAWNWSHSRWTACSRQSPRLSGSLVSLVQMRTGLLEAQSAHPNTAKKMHDLLNWGQKKHTERTPQGSFRDACPFVVSIFAFHCDLLSTTCQESSNFYRNLIFRHHCGWICLCSKQILIFPMTFADAWWMLNFQSWGSFFLVHSNHVSCLLRIPNFLIATHFNQLVLLWQFPHCFFNWTTKVWSGPVFTRIKTGVFDGMKRLTDSIQYNKSSEARILFFSCWWFLRCTRLRTTWLHLRQLIHCRLCCLQCRPGDGWRHCLSNAPREPSCLGCPHLSADHAVA